MNCASCEHTNPAGSRFCSGCGASLAPRCPACGTETPAGARFCNGCGSALGAHNARPASDGVSRKIVTIVFADLIGSVSLHERLDAESARRVMDRYHRAMAAAVAVHGGRVVQLLGDGVLAAFGVPRVAEDDAIRAVRAAVGMQRAFRELSREQGAAMEQVGLRVAVNTGEIVVGDDENSVMGDPTNVASRLQQEALDGDVIVGEGTQRLVGDLVTLAPLGTFALRGRTETVAAYRVVSSDRPASRQATAFVGRDEEMRRLQGVYDAAVATPAARLAVLLGSPGLGKSRLVAEFTRRTAERATVLAARCDADGGATFAPLAGALRTLLRIDEGAGGAALRAAIDAVVPGDEAERTRIATGIGALLAGTPAPPEETFFVVRRLLAALAAVRPVVLVIDDLQWAEPLLLDLVEHLVQWSSGVPLLLLVAARPELRDARSSLTIPGPLVADVVTLAGLDAGAATRHAANAIGGAELPAALAGRVLATSEGNPLFVSELVRMLVQDGTLQRDGDRWITTVEVAKLDMPPTIQVLLAARIERLRPEERSVLERAAVIGRQFSRAAVAHLLPREAHGLDAHLEALRRSEVIEPDTGWFLGEPALRFHHVLIRDAAYRRVLKETRAELHERLADWILGRVGEAIEHDETIGWHLEQAHQCRRELGALDRDARSLGERAARHLGSAGRRALARDDLPLAAGLLGRAIDRLDAADPARADLALDWCEALLAAGAVGPAAAAIDELARFCADSERLRAWHVCFVGQLAVLTDPQALHTTADAVAAAAEQLTALEDAPGAAKAHFVHAMALVRLGRVGDCEAALDRALAAARRAGDRRRANAVLAGAPVAALWGPSPVTRASGRCLDVVRVLRITQGAPAVEAVALRCQGVLEALRGRTDAARRMVESSRKLVEELGITQRLLEADVFAGHVELIEGDPEAAERCLRAAYDGLRDLGLAIDAAQAAALLGRALLAQGRAAEAEALSHESEALAGDDLKAAITWRGVRAEALARRGEHAAAIEFASRAVEIAAATDDLLDHADARQSLAVALRAAGRDREADAEETRAIELWDAKGATLLVERARRAWGGVVAGDGARADATETPLPARRQVQANFATENVRRLDAAVADGDAEAIRALFADDVVFDQRFYGVPQGQREIVAGLEGLLGNQRGVAFRNEPLATLGDALALHRCDIRFAGTAAAFDVPVGAVDIHWIILTEAGADARASRVEMFADGHLADASARLYQRYAELLPDGPARERAAATARVMESVASGEIEVDSLERIFAPGIELVDHRTAGLPPTRGPEALARALAAASEVGDDLVDRLDDVLAAESGAVLMRWTTTGRAREGGGAFEWPHLRLTIFGEDGRATRVEVFAVDRVEDALARFTELMPFRAPARRVHPNTSALCGERIRAAAHARDLDAIAAVIADDFHLLHHPTSAVVDREAGLKRWQLLLRAKDLRISNELLAVLGDSLALGRDVTSFTGLSQDGLSFGASQSTTLVLFESNAAGQATRIEVFSEEHLADAIVRLYQRHAERLSAGSEQIRAGAIARSVAAVLDLAADDSAFRMALSPDLEFADHQILGFGAARGGDRAARGHRVSQEVAERITSRVDDLLALRSDGLVARRTMRGVDRAGGGTFERQQIDVWVFASNGLLTHRERFDAADALAAVARFDALAASPAGPMRRVRPNAATANNARLEAAVAARDAEAIACIFADDAQTDHHPTGISYARDVSVARLRAILEARDLVRHESIATLGDSLALCHDRTSYSALVEGDIDIGAVERDQVVLTEVDARGQRRRAEFFAEDRLGDAIARLYTRYAELLPDGSARDRAAATARSVARWLHPLDHAERFRGVLAPDVEFVDHRPLGLGSGRGAESFQRGHRAQLELARDIALRVDDVLALEPAAFLLRTLTSGIDGASGGAYERPLLLLGVFGRDGLVVRAEWFDPNADAEALARFDEVAAERASDFANAVTRTEERFQRAWNTRDWEAFVALTSQGFRSIDRRPLMHLEVDRDTMLAGMRPFFEMGVKRSYELLATRGERLALFRMHLRGGDQLVGPSEVEWVQVIETDEEGARIAGIAFAPEDLDAAYAELDARYAAGEAAAERRAAVTRAFSRAFAERDWDALAALLAPDLVVRDHRLLGWEPLHGPDAYVEALRSLVDLAPDVRLRIDHVSIAAPRFLYVTTWVGTRDGGAFETPSVIVAEVDSEGRIRGFDQYDIDRLDEIRARFGAVAASPPRDPLRIPPNAATRASARCQEALGAADWDALARVCAPTMIFDDRRTGVLLTGDRDMFLAGNRVIASSGGRPLRTVLATAGDRLALEHLRWTGAGGDVGAFEAENLSVIEVDAEGRIAAIVAFDANDRRAASVEMSERWLRSDEAPPAAVAGAAAMRGLFEHDLAGLSAALPDDFFVDDHRHFGMGRVEGAAAFVHSFAALFEQSADLVLECLYTVAAANHATLDVAHMFGTVAATGGEFESVYVRLLVYRDDRAVGLELFDIEDLAAARARFEALRPDRPGTPSNVASRVSSRIGECFASEEWRVALRALASPAFRFEDRSRRALVDGDLELWIRNLEVVRAWPGRPTRVETIGAFGDRIVLEHLRFSGGSDGGDYEGEFLRLVEADASGRLCAVIHFDADDRRAAFEEAEARFAAGERARVGGQA